MRRLAFLGQVAVLGQGIPTNVSVAPIVHNGGFTPNQMEFTFWHNRFQTFPYYGFPQIYPNYVPPPAPNQRMICRKLEEESEREGRDVLECRYEQTQPVYTYPVVRLFPLY